MARYMDMGDCRQMLLDAAPKQVAFVALSRIEQESGYMCYYTVAEDPEDPRDYGWRCDRIDIRRLEEEDGHAVVFWAAQREVISRRGTPEARLWVERKNGERDGLECLLGHYGLENEFLKFSRERWGWDPDEHMGVVKLLPEEIEKRPAIARELLIKHLQKKGDG